MTFTGYLEVFYENCRHTKTYMQSWSLTESEYFQIFGQNRYSSYQSFSVVRKRNREKVCKDKK